MIGEDADECICLNILTEDPIMSTQMSTPTTRKTTNGRLLREF